MYMLRYDIEALKSLTGLNFILSGAAGVRLLMMEN